MAQVGASRGRAWLPITPTTTPRHVVLRRRTLGDLRELPHRMYLLGIRQSEARATGFTRKDEGDEGGRPTGAVGALRRAWAPGVTGIP